MEVVITKDKKKEFEFEIIGDSTILNLLKKKLLENKDVDYAGWSIEHPLLSNPKFYVRVKKGEAKEIVKKVISDIKKDIEEVKGQLEE
ncbi:MAG: RpoL/Rpb11 RNA polymerase subunit family protein [Candidatus Thermoplasmatota archaeon]|nr:RpoL/Rpb11 RNA polymerase subunit family protein [Candidatus Thermoplasmatota archaeon]